MADSVRLPGFLPSTCGLHFVNYYPHEPTLTITLPRNAAGTFKGTSGFSAAFLAPPPTL